MTQVKEMTLLEYVIAYLQEEQTRWTIQETNTPAELTGGAWNLTDADIRLMLNEALNAYAEGAR